MDKEKLPKEEPNMENQISFCCKMPIYGKGAEEGLFCKGCNREIFHTEYKYYFTRLGTKI